MASMQSKMQARAITRIMESGDWVAVQSEPDVEDRSSSNLSARISKWKELGLIFTISFQGEDYYPAFALDPQNDFLPWPGLKLILSSLEDRSGWEIAFWFDSPNSYLGGRRPKELLATDPEIVFFAAQMEVQGIGHG